VIAAISLSDIYDSKTDEASIAGELKETANKISASLGYNSIAKKQ
jgi:hypothetical protein